MNECFRHLLFFQRKMYSELKEAVSHRVCVRAGELGASEKDTVIGERQSSVFCRRGQWEEVRPEQTRQD